MGNNDPHLLDSEVIIEILLPRVFSVVTQNVVKDPNNLNALRKDHTVAFTAGVGTLPESIKEEYVESLYFPIFPYASYIPRYEEYSQLSQSVNIDYFTIQNRQIYFLPASVHNSVIVAGAGTAAANGTYTWRGIYASLDPYYNLNGQASSTTVSAISTASNPLYWRVWASNGDVLYGANTADGFPYDVMTWTADNGTNPVPTFTEDTTFTGNATINAITLPVLPTLISDTVVLKDNLVEEVITFMASVMSEKIPLSAIALDYPSLNNGPA